MDDQTLDSTTIGADASTASSTDASAWTLTDEQHDWASSFCGIETRADGQEDSIRGNRGGLLSALSSPASAGSDEANGMVSTTEKIAGDGNTVIEAAGSTVSTTEKVAGDIDSKDMSQAFPDAPSGAMDVRSSEGDGPPPVVPVQPAAGQASPAPPGPGAPQAVAQAKDSVASTYRVKSVSDGDAAWTEDQVKTVSGAFGKIPGADKDVLNGIEVKRVHAIDAEHAAQFSSETKVDENTPATQTNTIEVGDSTFSSGGQPVPAGEQQRVIVHEVGHAVAEKAQRKADLADAKAIEAENTAVAAYNDVNDKRNALIDESNDLVDKYNDAVTALNAANAAKPPDPDTVKAANDAFKVAKAASDAKKQELAKITVDWNTKKAALDHATAAQTKTKTAARATRVPDSAVQAGAAQVSSAATAAASAKQTADAAAAQMSDADQKVSEDYRKAVVAVDGQLKSYGDAIKAGNPDVDGHEKDLASALADRAAKRQKLDQSSNSKNPALAAFTATEKAQDDLAVRLKTQARLPDRSLPVQRFVEIVEKNNIQPDTAYAQKNWPFAPEEFFAEAYSIWRTDPDKLKADAKPLFDWLESGKYR